MSDPRMEPRRYGRNICSASRGTAEDVERCAFEVTHDTGVASRSQCQRKRGHGPGGILCSQHARVLDRRGFLSIPRPGEFGHYDRLESEAPILAGWRPRLDYSAEGMIPALVEVRYRLGFRPADVRDTKTEAAHDLLSQARRKEKAAVERLREATEILSRVQNFYADTAIADRKTGSGGDGGAE